MQTSQNFFSHGKTTKPTQRFSSSPKPFIEQSNTLSLKFQDLKTLMKKKQAQYQEELLIEDAERVHNFLNQVQETQRQNKQNSLKNSRKRLRREVAKFNIQAVQQFQKEWGQRFAKTVQELQQIQNLLESQQASEQQKLLNEIEDAKNGKNLNKLKLSKNTLEMEDQLRRLTKSQRYEEAYVVSARWQKAKKVQIHRFISQSVDHAKRALEKQKKKHEKERQLFADRLTKIYLKEKKRYEQQFDHLLKNGKTYEMDLTKIYSKINRTQRSKTSQSQSTVKKPTFSQYPSVMGLPKPSKNTQKLSDREQKEFESIEIQKEFDSIEMQKNEEEIKDNKQEKVQENIKADEKVEQKQEIENF